MNKVKKIFGSLLSMALIFSLVGCASKNTNSTTSDVKGDKEVDFLIVGYGLAGEAAALEANDIDPKASILVLEKMSETLAGGNSSLQVKHLLYRVKVALKALKNILDLVMNQILFLKNI